MKYQLSVHGVVFVLSVMMSRKSSSENRVDSSGVRGRADSCCVCLWWWWGGGAGGGPTELQWTRFTQYLLRLLLQCDPPQGCNFSRTHDNMSTPHCEVITITPIQLKFPTTGCDSHFRNPMRQSIRLGIEFIYHPGGPY